DEESSSGGVRAGGARGRGGDSEPPTMGDDEEMDDFGGSMSFSAGEGRKGDKKAEARGSSAGRDDGGKSKSFLTYDEVSEQSQQGDGPDQLDDVVGSLGDEDIEIVDGATQVKIAPKRIADEEAGDKKLVVAEAREEEDV